MTAPTHTRRTSVFCIRFSNPDPTIMVGVAGRLPNVIEHGEEFITFRSTDDAAAMRTARDVMAGLDDPWELTTGLGVHRRTVTP